jgi:hypothetical protein
MELHGNDKYLNNKAMVKLKLKKVNGKNEM